MSDADNNEHKPDMRELKAVATALEGELERLKENLETHRLLDHPQQQRIVRQLIDDIDERQDRLDELNLLIAAGAAPPAVGDEPTMH